MKQDIFTAKMFRRLFVPSLYASLGLAFADMADALVVGWRMGETGLTGAAGAGCGWLRNSRISLAMASASVWCR